MLPGSKRVTLKEPVFLFITAICLICSWLFPQVSLSVYCGTMSRTCDQYSLYRLMYSMMLSMASWRMSRWSDPSCSTLATIL